MPTNNVNHAERCFCLLAQSSQELWQLVVKWSPSLMFPEGCCKTLDIWLKPFKPRSVSMACSNQMKDFRIGQTTCNNDQVTAGGEYLSWKLCEQRYCLEKDSLRCTKPDTNCMVGSLKYSPAITLTTATLETNILLPWSEEITSCYFLQPQAPHFLR